MENNTKKVMIVDDDQFLIDMYSLKFKKEGFDVESATKGEEALEKLRGGLDPNILILDVVMPSLDGIGLLEKIRQAKFANKAVVIMLTNQGQKSDIDRANKLGVDGYIIKATTIPSEAVAEVVDIYNKKKK
ncbi:MAG: two component transcriptional regulator, two-component system, OmpR family, response regulator [Parcubacteria group bacterium]|nr:two component transcriptional regulator, two-component system, OmpR family, response regulator [Parcubacteria group bacterium]